MQKSISSLAPTELMLRRRTIKINYKIKSNKIFKKLLKKKVVIEKKLKYFTYNFKNASWLGKMYLFTKIHKRRMQRFRAPSNL